MISDRKPSTGTPREAGASVDHHTLGNATSEPNFPNYVYNGTEVKHCADDQAHWNQFVAALCSLEKLKKHTNIYNRLKTIRILFDEKFCS